MSCKKSASRRLYGLFLYNLYLYKIMELSMKFSMGPGPDPDWPWPGPSGPGPLRARARQIVDRPWRARARSEKIGLDLARTGLRTVYTQTHMHVYQCAYKYRFPP